MVSVIFTPRWFYGIDGIFEAVAVIAALLIAFYSYKLYKFTKEGRHLYFSLSFLGISMAFIAKILTNLTLISSTVHRQIGAFSYIYHGITLNNLLYVGGFFAYRLLFLLGLLGIYFVIHDFRAKKLVGFSAYLIIVLTTITTFSTWAYPVFYFTAAVLLFSIAQFYYDVFNGKRGHKKNKNAETLLNTFLVIMSAQLAFILVLLHLYFYVIAEALQLVGFLMLLYLYYKLVIKRKN